MREKFIVFFFLVVCLDYYNECAIKFGNYLLSSLDDDVESLMAALLSSKVFNA